MNTATSPYPITIAPVDNKIIQKLQMTMPLTNHEEKYDAQRQGRGLYLAAFVEGEPAGYIFIRWEQEHPETQLPVTLRSYIDAIEVNEKFDSDEIGNHLIINAENFMKVKGFHTLGFVVGLTDKKAIRFYLKQGYEPQRLVTLPEEHSKMKKWCVYFEKWLQV
jgi:ribosomal protein S18 acetylase RimI-like enzyme